MPKQNIFFDLLKGMCKDVDAIVSLFVELSRNFNNLSSYSRRAEEIEHRADGKTHEIIDRLNKTFITPFDREDIYHLTHELDEIIDIIENAIHSIYIYGIKQKFQAIDEFAVILAQASANLNKLVIFLEKPKYTAELKTAIVRLHELEDQGDSIFEKAISKLFEQETNSVKIIKTKDILEEMENAMDKFQKVSDIIEGIIVKSS